MINKNLIPKIEDAIGFKLYPKVVEYLVNDKYYFNQECRLEGATTAYILKQILDKDYISFIDEYKLKYTNEYCDMVPTKDYHSLYFYMFMDYYRRLKHAGLDVVEIVDNRKTKTNIKTFKIDNERMNENVCVAYNASKILIIGEDNKTRSLKDYISKIVNDTINNKDKYNG